MLHFAARGLEAAFYAVRLFKFQQGPRIWLRQSAGAAAPSGVSALHDVKSVGALLFSPNLRHVRGGLQLLPDIAGKLAEEGLRCR